VRAESQSEKQSVSEESERVCERERNQCEKKKKERKDERAFFESAAG